MGSVTNPEDRAQGAGPEHGPVGLSVAEVSALLGISQTDVRALVRNGVFPGAARDSRGAWRIPDEAVSEFEPALGVPHAHGNRRNLKLSRTLSIVSGVAFALTTAWFVTVPSAEPAAAVLVSLGSVVAARIAEDAKRRGSRWFKSCIAVPLLIGSLMGVVLSDDPAQARAPHVRLVFLDDVDGTLRQLSDPSVSIAYGANEFSYPMRLGIANDEDQLLELVKIEITYPEGVKVTTDGQERLTVGSNSLTIEHDLGAIPPDGRVTPMASFDRMTVSYPVSKLLEQCYVDFDYIPRCFSGYAPSAALQDDFEEDALEVAVQIEVYFQDFLPVSISFGIDVPSEVTVHRDGGKKVFERAFDQLEAEEKAEVEEYWLGPPPSAQPSESWEQRIFLREHPGGLDIRYAMYDDWLDTYPGAYVQMLWVDGVLRKMVFGDGRGTWQQVVHNDASPSPDLQWLYANVPAADWKPESFVYG